LEGSLYEKTELERASYQGNTGKKGKKRTTFLIEESLKKKCTRNRVRGLFQKSARKKRSRQDPGTNRDWKNYRFPPEGVAGKNDLEAAESGLKPKTRGFNVGKKPLSQGKRGGSAKKRGRGGKGGMWPLSKKAGDRGAAQGGGVSSKKSPRKETSREGKRGNDWIQPVLKEKKGLPGL